MITHHWLGSPECPVSCRDTSTSSTSLSIASMAHASAHWKPCWVWNELWALSKLLERIHVFRTLSCQMALRCSTVPHSRKSEGKVLHFRLAHLEQFCRQKAQVHSLLPLKPFKNQTKCFASSSKKHPSSIAATWEDESKETIHIIVSTSGLDAYWNLFVSEAMPAMSFWFPEKSKLLEKKTQGETLGNSKQLSSRNRRAQSWPRLFTTNIGLQRWAGHDRPCCQLSIPLTPRTPKKCFFERQPLVLELSLLKICVSSYLDVFSNSSKHISLFDS